MTRSEITARWVSRSVVLLLLAVCGCGSSPRIVVVSPQANIAFTSSRSLTAVDQANSVTNIWLTDSTGAALKPLTTLTNGSSASPAWSPNGAKIAFESFRALNGSNLAIPAANIWVMNADGSNTIPLTKLNAETVSSIHSAWSPDGTKIAYDSTRALDGRDFAINSVNIWVMNADGTGGVPLTTLRATAASSVSPVWSPDGKKILYTSSRAFSGFDVAIAVRNIWVMNADGSGSQPLTTITAASSSDPAWSPDGTKIAYMSARALDGSNDVGAANIWVMNADGSGSTPLTRITTVFDLTTVSPLWSPDGRKIAYVSSRALDGSDNGSSMLNIWVMNNDGSNPRPLTRLIAASSYQPAWSSDGSTILFCSTRALDGTDASTTYGTLNIWMMNSDGTGAKPLTRSIASGADSAGPQLKP